MATYANASTGQAICVFCVFGSIHDTLPYESTYESSQRYWAKAKGGRTILFVLQIFGFYFMHIIYRPRRRKNVHSVMKCLANGSICSDTLNNLIRTINRSYVKHVAIVHTPQTNSTTICKHIPLEVHPHRPAIMQNRVRQSIDRLSVIYVRRHLHSVMHSKNIGKKTIRCRCLCV